MRFLELSIPHFSAEGNFSGALNKLIIENMLATTDVVYLLPIFKPSLETSTSPYCITNFKELNPKLGNWNDFHFFVSEIHRLGKKVILDLVLNHTSPSHIWCNRPNFYVCDLGGKPTAPLATNWNDVIQLNHHNEAVVQELISVVDFWMEQHIDGFRFDATSFIPIEFWKILLPKLSNHIAWADTNRSVYRELPFTHFTTRLAANEEIHERSVVFTSNHDLLLAHGSIRNQYGERAQAIIQENKIAAPNYMAIPYEESNDLYCYNFLLTSEPI